MQNVQLSGVLVGTGVLLIVIVRSSAAQPATRIIISPAVVTAIGFVVVVTVAIAVGVLVGMALDSYVSKNTENKTNQLINSYGNNGNNTLWNLSPKNNPWAWAIGGGVLGYLLLVLR